MPLAASHLSSVKPLCRPRSTAKIDAAPDFRQRFDDRTPVPRPQRRGPGRRSCHRHGATGRLAGDPPCERRDGVVAGRRPAVPAARPNQLDRARRRPHPGGRGRIPGIDRCLPGLARRAGRGASTSAQSRVSAARAAGRTNCAPHGRRGTGLHEGRHRRIPHPDGRGGGLRGRRGGGGARRTAGHRARVREQRRRHRPASRYPAHGCRSAWCRRCGTQSRARASRSRPTRRCAAWRPVGGRAVRTRSESRMPSPCSRGAPRWPMRPRHSSPTRSTWIIPASAASRPARSTRTATSGTCRSRWRCPRWTRGGRRRARSRCADRPRSARPGCRRRRRAHVAESLARARERRSRAAQCRRADGHAFGAPPGTRMSTGAAIVRDERTATPRIHSAQSVATSGPAPLPVVTEIRK